MKFREKIKIILFVTGMLSFSHLVYAGIQCASCGAMNPTSPSAHVSGCPYGAQASSSSHSSGAHVSHGPSMKTMVATTVFGSLLESVLMSPPSAPAGPTPEQIAAQRQAEEQARQMAAEAEKQRILLQAQKQHEFMRSKAAVVNRLKGMSPTYVEDKNITTTNGLKLKTISPSSSSTEAHSGFFGIAGSVKPTVALLREPMADGMLTNVDPEWVKGPQALIEQRIEAPNKWANGIYASLKTKAPPLPRKRFDELQPGDVLLMEATGFSKLINKTDNLLSGDNASKASHTVLYLGMVNGVKHFMENVPFKGPQIILEDEFMKEYALRGAQVAKLVQPLNEKEAKLLYGAAVDLAAENRKDVVGSRWLGTNYGTWGDNDVVCSEADWALLKIAGRDISKSDDRIKKGLGVDFSPADFYKNEQYFLVSPLDMPQ